MATAGLGPAARSTGRRQQTRDLVLNAALDLFNEHGYLGVRVEDIAKQAGVSRATFYQHFAEREHVLSELFARLLDTEPKIAEPADPTNSESTEQRVIALVEDAVRQMLEQEQLAKFVYSLPVRHSALLRPGVQITPPVFTQVTSLLTQATERGELREDVPVALLARHVLAGMETALRDWAEGRVDDPLGHVRLMLGLAFHGVQPAESTPRRF